MKEEFKITEATRRTLDTMAELDIDTIKKMVDDLIVAHGDYLPKYH